MKFFFYLMAWAMTACYSDVKSSSGQIKFDSNSDGIEEMVLNSSGLGISGTPSSNLHVQGNAIITGEMSVGGSNGGANLNINGTIGFSPANTSTSITLSDESIYVADTSSDNIALTLPYAGNVTGRMITVKKKSSSNKVWITGGGNLIDEVPAIELLDSQNNLPSIKIVSDGQQWYILEEQQSKKSVSHANLLLYLNFDDSTPADASESSVGNNATFTLVGAANINTSAGLSGGALSLTNNGSTDYLRIGNISTIYTEFTCSAFVNMDTHSDHGTIFSRRDGTGLGRSWMRFDQGNLAFDTFIGGADADGAVLSPAYGVWHHFTVTYHQGSIKLYTNGVLDQTVSFTEEDATGDFLIGIHRGLSIQPFKGLVDEVKFFDYALSPDEVSVLAQDLQ